MDVRNAETSEIEHLVKIWYDGWRDAHADIVPEALARIRTLDNFRGRLPGLLPHTRVVGDVGHPLGFSITKDDELYQLYVSADARGKGVAKALIEEAEARLANEGLRMAWLACAIGNQRAARFYEKSGWRLADTFVSELEIPGGTFPMEVWRYEKELAVPLHEYPPLPSA